MDKPYLLHLKTPHDLITANLVFPYISRAYALAERRLTRSIIATLRMRGQSYRWLCSFSDSWLQMPEDETDAVDIENVARGLSWQKGNKPRTLIYNFTVPLVKNNVDLCLFDCAATQISSVVYKSPERYLALGELKGGIDPAGADEHWKTARSALTRIQAAFSSLQLSPKLFFVGAAIEKKMATEIWKLLEDGHLDNAANLTDENQVASFSSWLCNL